MYIKKTLIEMEIDSINRAIEQNLNFNQLNYDTFEIDNLDNGNHYIVNLDGEGYHCECPHHTHRHVECKHIMKVKIETGGNIVKKIDEFKVGDKLVFCNTMGKVENLQKANVVVSFIKKVNETKVLVKTDSLISGKELEFEVDYFLLK